MLVKITSLSLLKIIIQGKFYSLFISIVNKEVKTILNNNNTINWKKHFGCGIQIKQNFDKLHEYGNIDLSFQEELTEIKDKLFSGLKEYYSLPALKKQKLYVESDCNSPLQKYLMDFIYDQQDLYAFYDNIFLLNDNCEDELSLLKSSSDCLNITPKVKFPSADNVFSVKTEYLYFESFLINIDEAVKEFKSKIDREALAALRIGKFVIKGSLVSDGYYSENIINTK